MSETKVAVITGASSGIGMETALAFARKGYAVVLAARRREPLEETAQRCRQAGARGAMALPTDVADEAQVNALVDAAAKQFGRIDVMVNNAGFGLNARVHETTAQQMRRIFDVNFFGVFFGCKAVAPIMMSQRNGHIFNVSSVVGKRGSPLHGAYGAAKFAVCGLGDSMRVEMMDYGVRVTTVCPGLTDTEFFQHVEGGSHAHQSRFKAVRRLMPPAIVARKIVSSVGKNRPQLVFTWGGKVLVAVSTLFPRLADRMMKLYYDDMIGHMTPPRGR